MIDIKGLDKAEVLCALYNSARPFGMGYMHFEPGDMTVEEAQQIIKEHEAWRPRYLYFDYLKGRLIKCDISGDELNPRLYDRDYGYCACEDAIEQYFSKKANLQPDVSVK